MGLDGISINQLRNPLENVSREDKRVNSSKDEVKIVDGLASGQKVDPDKDREQDNSEFEFQDKKHYEEELDEDNNNEEIIKYDLSDSEKYMVKVDNDNNIFIIEKETSNIVQKINSEELMKLVSSLSNSSGSIVNCRF